MAAATTGRAGGAYVPGADWRQPEGPGSNLHSRDLPPGRAGRARGRGGVRGVGRQGGCRPRPSGSTLRAAGSTGAASRGATTPRPRGRMMANRWSGRVPVGEPRRRRRRGHLAGRRLPRERVRAVRHDGQRLGVDPRRRRAGTVGDPPQPCCMPETRGRVGPPGHQGRLAPVRAVLPAFATGRRPARGRTVRTGTSRHRLPLRVARRVSGAAVTWLGHATVLVELGGVRLITDPVLRRRGRPSATHGRGRTRRPARRRAPLAPPSRPPRRADAAADRRGCVVVGPAAPGRSARHPASRGRAGAGDELTSERRRECRAARRSTTGAGRRPRRRRRRASASSSRGGRESTSRATPSCSTRMAGSAPLDVALLPVWGWGP